LIPLNIKSILKHKCNKKQGANKENGYYKGTIMNDKIQDLLAKEISRKDFLGLIGAGILSVVGVSTLLKNIGGIKTSSVQTKELGYGQSTYGGTTKQG
jgi:hypothetical protein